MLSYGEQRDAHHRLSRPIKRSLKGVAKKAMHILHATAVFICTFIILALMPMFNKLQWWMQARSLPLQQDPMTSFLAQ
jgi:hypothetical protein